tara:strand:+ start:6862 stop:7236 length:375 start_codon:yes stop_codon:yes gene_type:complete
MNPSARTLAELRKQGISACVVERWIAPARRRVDMFGFADLVALPNGGITAIQVTSGSNHASHRTKITGCPDALKWLDLGGLIELWSWRKLKVKRGGKAVRWTPRIEAITKGDFGHETDTETHDN